MDLNDWLLRIELIDEFNCLQEYKKLKPASWLKKERKISSVCRLLNLHREWRPRWLSWMRRPTRDLAGRQHSFVEIDHEIFSTVILSLPLIQEGQLSVSGERMCTILVNRLED